MGTGTAAGSWRRRSSPRPPPPSRCDGTVRACTYTPITRKKRAAWKQSHATCGVGSRHRACARARVRAAKANALMLAAWALLRTCKKKQKIAVRGHARQRRSCKLLCDAHDAPSLFCARCHCCCYCRIVFLFLKGLNSLTSFTSLTHEFPLCCLLLQMEKLRFDKIRLG